MLSASGDSVKCFFAAKVLAFTLRSEGHNERLFAPVGSPKERPALLCLGVAVRQRQQDFAVHGVAFEISLEGGAVNVVAFYCAYRKSRTA